jgi:hypothetical protein
MAAMHDTGRFTATYTLPSSTIPADGSMDGHSPPLTWRGSSTCAPLKWRSECANLDHNQNVCGCITENDEYDNAEAVRLALAGSLAAVGTFLLVICCLCAYLHACKAPRKTRGDQAMHAHTSDINSATSSHDNTGIPGHGYGGRATNFTQPGDAIHGRRMAEQCVNVSKPACNNSATNVPSRDVTMLPRGLLPAVLFGERRKSQFHDNYGARNDVFVTSNGFTRLSSNDDAPSTDRLPAFGRVLRLATEAHTSLMGRRASDATRATGQTQCNGQNGQTDAGSDTNATRTADGSRLTSSQSDRDFVHGNRSPTLETGARNPQVYANFAFLAGR